MLLMRSVGYEPPCHHTGPHLFENCYVSWHCKADEVSCCTHFGWLQSFEVCDLRSIGFVFFSVLQLSDHLYQRLQP